MIIISHRGNIFGSQKDKENHPDYINEAINLGYNCEVDVWKIDNELWLGHDKPQYLTNLKYLSNKKLWCHSKNIEALSTLLLCRVHCFTHDKDPATLTSENYIWHYPGVLPVNKLSIIVMPELMPEIKYDYSLIAGVCTDYPINYK